MSDIVIDTPGGRTWTIDVADASRKLSLRAALPGARVFDHCADALRESKALGLAPQLRLALALPSSWMVNSPADSRVMRRWALPPARDGWVEIAEALDLGREAWLEGEGRGTLLELLPQLGEEAFLVEAASKLLALLAPDMVPLMPKPARAFVLGDDERGDVRTFLAMVDWFCDATIRNEDALAEIARHHAEVVLSAPQVLDRLLWFDSEGHRHFEKKPTKEEGGA
jgi:hypothetical protein